MAVVSFKVHYFMCACFYLPLYCVYHWCSLAAFDGQTVFPIQNIQNYRIAQSPAQIGLSWDFQWFIQVICWLPLRNGWSDYLSWRYLFRRPQFLCILLWVLCNKCLLLFQVGCSCDFLECSWSLSQNNSLKCGFSFQQLQGIIRVQ